MVNTTSRVLAESVLSSLRPPKCHDLPTPLPLSAIIDKSIRTFGNMLAANNIKLIVKMRGCSSVSFRNAHQVRQMLTSWMAYVYQTAPAGSRVSVRFSLVQPTSGSMPRAGTEGSCSILTAGDAIASADVCPSCSLYKCVSAPTASSTPVVVPESNSGAARRLTSAVTAMARNVIRSFVIDVSAWTGRERNQNAAATQRYHCLKISFSNAVQGHSPPIMQDTPRMYDMSGTGGNFGLRVSLDSGVFTRLPSTITASYCDTAVGANGKTSLAGRAERTEIELARVTDAAECLAEAQSRLMEIQGTAVRRLCKKYGTSCILMVPLLSPRRLYDEEEHRSLVQFQTASVVTGTAQVVKAVHQHNEHTGAVFADAGEGNQHVTSPVAAEVEAIIVTSCSESGSEPHAGGSVVVQGAEDVCIV
jgi:hypothetical protein